MPIDSTTNLEALIREESSRQRTASTALETRLQNAVAEWAQSQAATRIALEYRLAESKAEADSLRQQNIDLGDLADRQSKLISELQEKPERIMKGKP